jgi:hypothetical protein
MAYAGGKPRAAQAEIMASGSGEEGSMTRKEKILRMVQRLEDDATYDQVIYRLVVMRDIETALDQAERGEGTEHEELFRRLKKESKSSGLGKARC